MQSKAMSRKSMDMTTGSPLKQIVLFGLPILVGNIFQQLYSMVDSIVVGKFVSAGALAAVGATGHVSGLLVSAAMGLTTGASIVAAQLMGARDFKRIKAAISTTLIFMLSLSVVMSVVGVLATDLLCTWTQVPADIFEEATTYLRIYMGGLVFLMLYNFFASMLRSFGDSTTPLIFLIISSVLNIIGDLWFVIGLDMGVAGVAWATLLSQAISVGLCILYVSRRVEYFRFGKGDFVFDKNLFKEILRLGIPSALQGSVMSLGFVLVQGLINTFGSAHIAAYTAASKMEMLSHLPVDSFAMGYSVYVGQNMGAGNVQRTKEGMRKTLLMTGGLCIGLAVLLFFVGEHLVGLFVEESETVVIQYGAQFLRTCAPFTVLFACMNVFNSTLRGAGDSVFSMAAMMCDLGGRVVAAYILCSIPAIGFLGIAYAIPTGWGLAALVSFLRYRTGKWQTKVVKIKS